jgi:hypothetical protein
VDVPEMTYAGQLTNDPDAITITLEKQYDPQFPRDEEKAKVVYEVRVGQMVWKADQTLDTPEKALDALNKALAGVTRPPEVRIACQKDLPRERVYELRRELEPLRKRGIINSTVATVVEAPKQ